MAAPAEDPQVHGQGPGRVSLSDSSGTEGEQSDSYQVFPDYSQLVPEDRTQLLKNTAVNNVVPHRISPIMAIMSSQVVRFHQMNHGSSEWLSGLNASGGFRNEDGGGRESSRRVSSPTTPLSTSPASRAAHTSASSTTPLASARRRRHSRRRRRERGRAWPVTARTR